MHSGVPECARLPCPSWLWGGRPERFLAECHYKVRSKESGDYWVQPEERYTHALPDLLKSRPIAGPSIKTPRYDLLATLTEPIQPPMPAGMEAAIRRRETGQDLVDMLSYERLRTYVTPLNQLPDRAAELISTLQSLPLNESLNVKPFADAGLHTLEVNRALLHRLKIASVWIRMEHDERLGRGDVRHLNDGEDPSFASSAGLYDGVYTMDAYIAPLLGALAPAVWAFNVPRPFGSLIFTLGRCAAGTKGDPAELLQMISVPGSDSATAVPSISGQAPTAAIAWWASRLNHLLGVTSDLSVFAGPDGSYRADKHLQAMLTMEQVFRRTTSMQVAQRDAHARRTLMFSVLDSMQSLNGWDLLTMFRLSHAQRVLHSLEESMSDAAGEVLLPMAYGAVEALRRVQGGFFLRTAAGQDSVRLRSNDGHEHLLPPEKATAIYMKLLRDATHGHGGKGKTTEQTAGLLAQHDGRVPHEIGLLAYLYLLDVIANPDRLRRCLHVRAQ